MTERAQELAALEIRWWRLHHEKNRAALPHALAEFFAALFSMPLDHATVACAGFLRAVGAHDAKTWNAQSDLKEFYGIVKRATGRSIRVAVAARLEERWWRLHDDSSDVPGDTVLADTIAQLYQCLFQISADSARRLAHWRLQAIHAHDQAEAPTTSVEEAEACWTAAAAHLEAAYRELQTSVVSDERSSSG